MTATEAKELSTPVQRLEALIPGDAQLQSLLPDPAVEAAAGTTESYAEAIAVVLEGYASRPALSVRAHDVVTDVTTGRSSRVLRSEFASVTYGELHRRAKALASVFTQDETHRVNPEDFVCVMGFTGVDFVTVEIACAFAQGVVVPMRIAMGRPAVEAILAKTDPVMMASTVADVVFAAESVIGQSSIRARCWSSTSMNWWTRTASRSPPRRGRWRRVVRRFDS